MKDRSLEERLDLAKLAMVVERAKLVRVMEDPEVWHDGSRFVNGDIIKAAAICGLEPGELAGYAEVLKRVKAVRGTTGEVARLTAKLNDSEPRRGDHDEG